MLTFANLLNEVQRNDAAREAMSLIGAVLERRSLEEQDAFWRAIDLYYVSRKAPGIGTASEADRPEDARSS